MVTVKKSGKNCHINGHGELGINAYFGGGGVS